MVITDVIDMNLGKLREMVRGREAWHTAVHRVAEPDWTEQLNNNNLASVIQLRKVNQARSL